jgi:hypothetical protein
VRRQSDSAKLQEVVTAYKEASKECTRERFPQQWSLLQNDLADALCELDRSQADNAKLERL